MEGNNTRRFTPKNQQLYDYGGRRPPRDTELEEAVLGALMLEKDAYTAVCDILKPESFYEPANKKIYEAIQNLGASQRPIDTLTVTEQLRLNGTLDEVGGPVFVSELTLRVASGANAEYHARIVAQKYLARELISFAADIEKRLLTKVTTSMTLCRKPRDASLKYRSAMSRRMSLRLTPS